MIIVIANTKGGVGKTTVAVHLAAWLYEQGHRVILADCDTQRSSSEWIRQAMPEIPALKLDTPTKSSTSCPSSARRPISSSPTDPGARRK